MDFTAEEENKACNHNVLPNKSSSENDIYLKRLYIVPHDDGSDEGLRIIGINVKLDNGEAYSLAVERARSKSTESLTLVAGESELGHLIIQGHCDVSNGMNNLMEPPFTNGQLLPQKEKENFGRVSLEKITMFDKLESLSSKSVESELQIKSENIFKHSTSEETISSVSDYYDTDDRFTNLEEIFWGTKAAHFVELISSSSSEFPQNYETDLLSTEVREEKKAESLSVQTSRTGTLCVESNEEEITSNSGKSRDSTSSEFMNIDLINLDIDDISENKVLSIIDSELFCSTHTVQLTPVLKSQLASSRSVEFSDAATSTDFNIYTVDRGEFADKSTDTEDFPYAFQMIPTKEREVTEDKCFMCSRDHPKSSENSFKRSNPTQIDALLTTTRIHQKYELITASRTTVCNLCHLEKSYDSSLGNTILPENVCKCRTLNAESKLDTAPETVKKLKPISSMKLSEMVFSSLNSQKNSTNLSKVKVVKILSPEVNITEANIATRVQRVRRIERADILKVPVVFSYSLNSFNLLPHYSSRGVINPIKISYLTTRKLAEITSETDKNKEISSEPSPDEESESKSLVPQQAEIVSESNKMKQISSEPSLNEELVPQLAEIIADKVKKKEISIEPSPDELGSKSLVPQLMMPDTLESKVVVVSSLPPTIVTEEVHLHVSLCNSCYTDVQKALQEKLMKSLQKESEVPVSSNESKFKGDVKEEIRSLSPKIEHQKFDYLDTDTWTPRDLRENNFAKEITESLVGDKGSDSSQKSSESLNETMDLNSACETVNDHLLNLRSADPETVRKGAETLHRTWFETTASKHVDVDEVRFYLRYFEEFSDNLLKTLLYSTDNNGNNVMHFAFANNRFDLVEEIMNNGFGAELLKKTNKIGNSPLMLCAISQPTNDIDWSVVRRSFEMGDVNAKSSKIGQTPLMHSASRGFDAMVGALLESGADPNLQDGDGSTALMYAAEHGHEECVKALVRHESCDPTLKDEDGETACTIALNNGHKGLAVLIHSLTLEKRRTNKNKSTPLRFSSNVQRQIKMRR